MPEVNYLWDPIEDNVIAEFDEGGGVVAEYTTEPEQYGNVVSQRRDGETNCFYSDGIGSTTEVTDAAGNTIATRAYGAYGEATETAGDLVFPFQFVGLHGYYFDEDTGKYYIRMRVYDPSIARWLSQDPISDADRRSLFEYAMNGPLIHGDATGLLSQTLDDKTFSNPLNWNCGKYQWVTTWLLDLNEKDGYIVQLISPSKKFEKCPNIPACPDGKKEKIFCDSPLLTSSAGTAYAGEIGHQPGGKACDGQYVELWVVKNGTIYVNLEINDPNFKNKNPKMYTSPLIENTDMSFQGFGTRTHGKLEMRGDAFFVSLADFASTNKLIALEKMLLINFEQGPKGVMSAGFLPSWCGQAAANWFKDVLANAPSAQKSSVWKTLEKGWNCCSPANGTRYTYLKLQQSDGEPFFAPNSVQPNQMCSLVIDPMICGFLTDCEECSGK